MAIKWLKRAAERLMNHTGAPDFVAVYVFMYLALVNNWTADPELAGKLHFRSIMVLHRNLCFVGFSFL
jgi:hypothetical protein